MIGAMERRHLAWGGADLSGERVLVTGGAGVIADELLELLGRTNAGVLSVDRLPLARPLPPSTEHVVADLADVDFGDLRDFDPTVILHLAATFERSVESAEFWEQNWSDNVVVTHRLAELAASSGRVRSFVFASSYLVYGTSRYLFPEPKAEAVALTEEAPVGPRNLCGAAKYYGEAELAFARDVLGGRSRTVAARIFRVYGRGSRDVVSRWVRAAIRKEPIEVYQPENRFDYVFSGDVAEGLLRMAIEPRATGILNLGSGQDRSVAEVIGVIEAATGHSFERRAVRVDGPYEASRADLTTLHDRLGWSPTTSLEDGVRRLVEHEQAAYVRA
jgi:nucleoside-diphosphate-sugar epimerase